MKTEAENIQRKISQRLKKMKNTAANVEDVKYLWDWSHRLYEHAKEFELNERDGVNKLRQIKEILEM
jgi:hypothetical protein